MSQINITIADNIAIDLAAYELATAPTMIDASLTGIGLTAYYTVGATGTPAGRYFANQSDFPLVGVAPAGSIIRDDSGWNYINTGTIWQFMGYANDLTQSPFVITSANTKYKIINNSTLDVKAWVLFSAPSSVLHPQTFPDGFSCNIIGTTNLQSIGILMVQGTGMPARLLADIFPVVPIDVPLEYQSYEYIYGRRSDNITFTSVSDQSSNSWFPQSRYLNCVTHEEEDGWGNPATKSTGKGYQRFTLSQEQYIALDSNIGRVTVSMVPALVSPPPYSADGSAMMNQTFIVNCDMLSPSDGTVGYDLSAFNISCIGARIRFVCNNNIALIILPVGVTFIGAVNVADYNVGQWNTPLYSIATGRSFMKIGDNTACDTVELQVGASWSHSVFDFYSWSAGELPWDRVSKAGSLLGHIGDVNIPAPSNNNVLTWDLATGKWIAVNRNLLSSGGAVGNGTDQTFFEADGTIRLDGNATVWDDIDFPVMIRTTGSNIPTVSILIGNLTMPLWQINDFYVCEVKEFRHDWKEASPVQWHIHMFTGALLATNSYLNFEIEYTWANRLSALTAPVIISTELMIPANTPALTHYIYNIGSAWTPTAGTIAAHIKPRLRRIAQVTGGTTGSNPYCEMVQLHYEKDTLGSRLITTK